MYGSYLLPEAKAVSTDALFKYLYILGYTYIGDNCDLDYKAIGSQYVAVL